MRITAATRDSRTDRRQRRFFMLSIFGMTVALLLLAAQRVPRAHADGPDDLLPVFTTPIDITGKGIQVHVTVPDRDTGKPVDAPLPLGLAGPLFNTPLNQLFDQYWAVTPDPKTGKIPRDEACNSPDGIIKAVRDSVSQQGESAYDISCNLATKGTVLVQQVGYTLYVAYQLTNNTVSFKSTSSYTCKEGHSTPFCPNDPSFTVTFATQLVTVLRVADICHIYAGDGTVYVVAAQIESNNFAGDAAKLFGGQKFVRGEVAITDTVKRQPLPIDGYLRTIRDSQVCTDNSPLGNAARASFTDVDVDVHPARGIVITADRKPITVPTVDAPNPGAAGAPSAPRYPSFTHPSLATSQPLVIAGNTVQVSGQYFPPNTNLSTALPLAIGHGGYGENSVILGGPCTGGATELEWGPVGGPLKTLKLPGTEKYSCAAGYNAIDLSPATAYQFRVRDCDAITCSLWSAPLKVTTAGTGDKGKVVLTLDNGTTLGTATVDAQGEFETRVTIPAGTPPGHHRVYAVNGDAKADAGIEVRAQTSGPAAATGTLQVVALLNGQTGCPNNPVTGAQVDDTFRLFGAAFAPGAVEIRVDSLGGQTLATLTAGADGSFCTDVKSVTRAQAGKHTLVAVQNGVEKARLTIDFVLPYVVR